MITRLRGVGLICWTVGNCQRLSNFNKNTIFSQVNVGTGSPGQLTGSKGWKKLRELEGNKEAPFRGLHFPIAMAPSPACIEPILLGWLYYSSLAGGEWGGAEMLDSNSSPCILRMTKDHLAGGRLVPGTWGSWGRPVLFGMNCLCFML